MFKYFVQKAFDILAKYGFIATVIAEDFRMRLVIDNLELNYSDGHLQVIAKSDDNTIDLLSYMRIDSIRFRGEYPEVIMVVRPIKKRLHATQVIIAHTKEPKRVA